MSNWWRWYCKGVSKCMICSYRMSYLTLPSFALPTICPSHAPKSLSRQCKVGVHAFSGMHSFVMSIDHPETLVEDASVRAVPCFVLWLDQDSVQSRLQTQNSVRVNSLACPVELDLGHYLLVLCNLDVTRRQRQFVPELQHLHVLGGTVHLRGGADRGGVDRCGDVAWREDVGRCGKGDWSDTIDLHTIEMSTIIDQLWPSGSRYIKLVGLGAKSFTSHATDWWLSRALCAVLRHHRAFRLGPARGGRRRRPARRHVRGRVLRLLDLLK